MEFSIETEQEADSRWIAEIPALPGVLAYGVNQEDAIKRAKELAWKVVEDRRKHGKKIPGINA